MSYRMWVLVCITFLAFIGIVLTGVHLEETGKRDEMKACVAAGNEWKRTFGNHYDCVKPEKVP